jgi:hypothetical protein
MVGVEPRASLVPDRRIIDSYSIFPGGIIVPIFAFREYNFEGDYEIITQWHII